MLRGKGTKRQREMRRHLRRLAPRIPYGDAEAVLDGALAPHLRHLPPAIALWQAMTARVRHAHSPYETLLVEGYDRDAARFFVLDDMNATLQDWGVTRRVDADGSDNGADHT